MIHGDHGREPYCWVIHWLTWHTADNKCKQWPRQLNNDNNEVPLDSYNDKSDAWNEVPFDSYNDKSGAWLGCEGAKQKKQSQQDVIAIPD